MQMPVMDGLTAVRELRRREREGEIPRHYVRMRLPSKPLFSVATDRSLLNLQPVCAVTGNAREAQRKECLEAGFDDVRPLPHQDVLVRPVKANSPALSTVSRSRTSRTISLACCSRSRA